MSTPTTTAPAMAPTPPTMRWSDALQTGDHWHDLELLSGDPTLAEPMAAAAAECVLGFGPPPCAAARNINANASPSPGRGRGQPVRRGRDRPEAR